MAVWKTLGKVLQARLGRIGLIAVYSGVMVWGMPLSRMSLGLEAGLTLTNLGSGTLSSTIVAQQEPIVFARPTPITAEDAARLQQVFANETGSTRTRSVIVAHTVQVTLPNFGSCWFVPVVMDHDGQATLSLYLVKDQHVVYTFPQPSWVTPWHLHRLHDVRFVELNFDGGDGDIVLISHYIDKQNNSGGSASFPVVTVYLSADWGYDLDDDISQILTQRKVETIDAAVDIMQREFLYIP